MFCFACERRCHFVRNTEPDEYLRLSVEIPVYLRWILVSRNKFLRLTLTTAMTNRNELLPAP
jgi:hypothetical protein